MNVSKATVIATERKKFLSANPIQVFARQGLPVLKFCELESRYSERKNEGGAAQKMAWIIGTILTIAFN